MLAAMLAGVACGDGSGGSTEEAMPSVSASVSPTARPSSSSEAENDGASVDDAPTLQPPPAKDADDIALVVVAGDRSYQPTVGEFADLPAVSTGGLEGVTLATLAAQLGVEGDAVVTIEGRSQDLGAVRYWRGTLSEAGESVVVSIGDDGLATFGGEGLEKPAWLYSVESVAFQ